MNEIGGFEYAPGFRLGEQSARSGGIPDRVNRSGCRSCQSFIDGCPGTRVSSRICAAPSDQQRRTRRAKRTRRHDARRAQLVSENAHLYPEDTSTCLNSTPTVLASIWKVLIPRKLLIKFSLALTFPCIWSAILVLLRVIRTPTHTCASFRWPRCCCAASLSVRGTSLRTHDPGSGAAKLLSFTGQISVHAGSHRLGVESGRSGPAGTSDRHRAPMATACSRSPTAASSRFSRNRTSFFARTGATGRICLRSGWARSGCRSSILADSRTTTRCEPRPLSFPFAAPSSMSKSRTQDATTLVMDEEGSGSRSSTF